MNHKVGFGGKNQLLTGVRVQCCFMSTETVRTGSPGRPSRLSHSSWALNNLPVVWIELYNKVFRTALVPVSFQCCFASTETIRLIRAQDGHLDFHTAPELWITYRFRFSLLWITYRFRCLRPQKSWGLLGTWGSEIYRWCGLNFLTRFFAQPSYAVVCMDSFTSHTVQSLLRCPYGPRVPLHASTSVRTLKIPNTGRLDTRKYCAHW